MVILRLEIATEMVTLPKWEVPVPEYVPAAYVGVEVLAVAVVPVAEAPTTGVLAALVLPLETMTTGLAAAAAMLTAAGWVESRLRDRLSRPRMR